jgi:hypothetical protein
MFHHKKSEKTDCENITKHYLDHLLRRAVAIRKAFLHGHSEDDKWAFSTQQLCPQPAASSIEAYTPNRP